MSDEIKPNAETAALSNDDLGDVTGGAAAPKTFAAAASAGKGGTNPLHSAVASPTEPSTELPEADLDNVAGGKGQVHDIHITKVVDKGSPNLF